MSIRAISAAIALQGTSSSEKLLLIALANYADENLYCYPSQRRLAADTCLTDRSIRSLLKKLQGREMIDREERRRPNNSRTADIYFLRCLAGSTTDNSGPPEVASNPLRNTFPGGGEITSGLTSFDPSCEPSSEPVERPTRRSRARSHGGSHRVPVGWEPAAVTMDSLAREGFTPGDLDRALTRMRDHEFRNPRSDWEGAFKNWVRREADFNNRRHHDQQLTPAAGTRQSAREANYERAIAGAQAAARIYGTDS